MFLLYVSKQLVTAVLPKKVVKSLRYMTILCLHRVQGLIWGVRGIKPRNYLRKNSKYCRKNAKIRSTLDFTIHKQLQEKGTKYASKLKKDGVRSFLAKTNG